jgi:four helix bundle protein
MARGSLLEMETQLDIALDLGYLDQNQQQTLAQEIYQILGLPNRLIDAVRRKSVLP